MLTPLFQIDIGKGDAVEPHRSRRRLQQPRDEVEHRRLAGAGLADDREALSRRDHARHPGHRRHGPPRERHAHGVELDAWRTCEAVRAPGRVGDCERGLVLLLPRVPPGDLGHCLHVPLLRGLEPRRQAVEECEEHQRARNRRVEHEERERQDDADERQPRGIEREARGRDVPLHLAIGGRPLGELTIDDLQRTAVEPGRSVELGVGQQVGRGFRHPCRDTRDVAAQRLRLLADVPVDQRGQTAEDQHCAGEEGAHDCRHDEEDDGDAQVPESLHDCDSARSDLAALDQHRLETLADGHPHVARPAHVEDCGDHARAQRTLDLHGQDVGATLADPVEHGGKEAESDEQADRDDRQCVAREPEVRRGGAGAGVQLGREERQQRRDAERLGDPEKKSTSTQIAASRRKPASAS